MDHYKVFTAPNPVLTATIHNASGNQVGVAKLAVSPRNDRVYIFDIKVTDIFRRQGYGLAFLQYLAKVYCQPITPIKELFSANAFWEAARRDIGSGLTVTMQLSVSEMACERLRWCLD